jgi:predicted nucleic acid-binding protein
MILVDTTVWIDFFRGKNTAQVNFFESSLLNQQEIFICGIILTELLQGISNNKEHTLVSSSLESFTYLNMNRETYLLAADIYRQLRAKGITIRKTVDCIIAAAAIENNLLLLHKDKDFLPIVNHCGLKDVTF